MGLALRTANHLNLDLPSMVWKQILGVPVTFEDLDAIDRFACMVRARVCMGWLLKRELMHGAMECTGAGKDEEPDQGRCVGSGGCS